jgi:hypothetical protein
LTSAPLEYLADTGYNFTFEYGVVALKRTHPMKILLAFLLGLAPSVESGPAYPVNSPQSPALTDRQIIQAINKAGLDLVRLKLQYISCGWIRPTPTSPSPALTSDRTSGGGYSAWLNYVAAHVRSGTSFDSDYSDVAKAALAGVVIDQRSETCLEGPSKDLERQQVINQADPVEVGLSLFATFRSYDQDTRAHAADMIAEY